MNAPIYPSGTPFDFEITMSKDIEPGSIVSVLISTYHFGRHLHGNNKGDDTEVSIVSVQGPTISVHVPGEKCRLLPTGTVKVRAVVKRVDGEIEDVQNLIVAVIGKKRAEAEQCNSGGEGGITAGKVALYDAHLNDKENPHAVTKQQVGLGNVENIAPADMPVSDAVRVEIDGVNNNLTKHVNNTAFGVITGISSAARGASILNFPILNRTANGSDTLPNTTLTVPMATSSYAGAISSAMFKKWEAYEARIAALEDALGYWVDTAGVKHMFELGNTPIGNFNTSNGATGTITINGTAVVKNTITNIVFGRSYDGVTSLGNNFLRQLSALTAITLPKNITTIVGYFMTDCFALKNIVLPNTITSIGTTFMANCTALQTVTIGSIDASLSTIVNIQGFANVTNTSTRKLVGTAVAIAKWKEKFTNCSAWGETVVA